jgi:hypothetical protein
MGSIKDKEFFDQLRGYQIPKEDAFAWGYLIGWLHNKEFNFILSTGLLESKIKGMGRTVE